MQSKFSKINPNKNSNRGARARCAGLDPPFDFPLILLSLFTVSEDKALCFKSKLEQGSGYGETDK